MLKLRKWTKLIWPVLRYGIHVLCILSLWVFQRIQKSIVVLKYMEMN